MRLGKNFVTVAEQLTPKAYPMRQFVIYRRVSTKDQGLDGLGMEVQDRDIRLFLSTSTYVETAFEVLAEFTEVQSGNDVLRPQLAEALALCRKTGAELLVSKLDRLSRKVSFIATLMDDPKIKLRVASMPHADNFQLHIYAALAEQERAFISLRTKAALAAAKAKGKRLGGLRDKTMKRNAAVQANAAARAYRLAGIVQPLRQSGATLQGIADELNRAGIPTARGGSWHAKQVQRVLERVRV